MRLHRPFLSRSFLDPKYTPSRQICLDAAKQILAFQAAPEMAAAWACMSYETIAASTVLLVDLMHDPENEEGERWKGTVRAAKERLKQYKSVSVRLSSF
jgi:hypothetical protein